MESRFTGAVLTVDHSLNSSGCQPSDHRLDYVFMLQELPTSRNN